MKSAPICLPHLSKHFTVVACWHRPVTTGYRLAVVVSLFLDLREKMGNSAIENAKVEVNENILQLSGVRSKLQNLKIPLSRPLNVHLIPQFATTDTPGRSSHYKLQLTFGSSQGTGEDADFSVSSTETSPDEGKAFHVVVQFTETVTKERRKSIVGLSRRTSVVKYNTWTSRTNDVLIDKKRIRVKGQLKQNLVDESEGATLDLDLILCPSDLIIPETDDEWLLIGTLYLSNLRDRKDFKWRAALSKDVKNT